VRNVTVGPSLFGGESQTSASRHKVFWGRTSMLKRILRCCQVVALAGVSCLAQDDLSPHFEVAAVKPAKGFGPFSGGPGSSDPERVTYQGTTLETLICGAYNLQRYQLSGPSWLRTEFYTVTAKLPAGTKLEQYRQMEMNLLAERFGLVFHRLTKDFDGYEIVVVKGAPKLNPSEAATGERPIFRGISDGKGTMKYKFTQTSMAALANRVGVMMDMTSPIVDRTGITGKFDFTLDVEMPPRGSSFDWNTISDALQHQLGLKLNHIKIPLEVLVIDRVYRVPTAN
jgi:uncharacterized protein (TIGR03435 family)